MPHIITRKLDSVEQNWLQQLTNAISNPAELLQQLEIDPALWQNGFAARKLFALRVPQSFVDRMEKGNPYDPCCVKFCHSMKSLNGMMGTQMTRLMSKTMPFRDCCINTATEC